VDPRGEGKRRIAYNAMLKELMAYGTAYSILKCDIDLRLLVLALAKHIIIISAHKQTYVRFFFDVVTTTE
jgi:hypothetical protein